MSFTVLRFDVGGLACAFDVKNVVEVVRIVAMTHLPHAPAAFSGVVNLRGLVLPVVDLRVSLNEPRRAYDIETRIIVVPLALAVRPREASGKEPERRLGFIVDRVNDVHTLPKTAERGDKAVSSAAPGLVAKIVQGADRLILLFDPQTLVADELSASIQTAWSAQATRGAHAA